MKKHPDQQRRELSAAQQDLFDTIACLDDASEIDAFLSDLCTPAELEALVDRWRVVRLLKKGLPYRQIHDLTSVSVTTIGRVARFLDHGAGGYQTALKRSPANDD